MPGARVRGPMIIRDSLHFTQASGKQTILFRERSTGRFYKHSVTGGINFRTSFRYPDGNYQVELYFVEPWYGTGGGMDCKGWRLFDVAINDEVKIKNLDIWNEAGHDRLLKKTLNASVTGGKLKISFPKVMAGQALVSAIAISTLNPEAKPAPSSAGLISGLDGKKGWSVQKWMNTGDCCFSGSDSRFVSLPSVLYGAEWVRTPATANQSMVDSPSGLIVSAASDVFIGLLDSVHGIPSFRKSDQKISTSKNGETYYLWQKRVEKGGQVELSSILGATQGRGLLIAAVPVSSMNDAIDLRTVTTLQASDAKGSGLSHMGNYSGKDCMIVPGKGDAVEWQFSVGLASRYGLEFRYMGLSEQSFQMEMSILTLDGTEIWKGQVVFDQPGDKWKSLRTDTHTTINAGTYKLKLSLDKEGPGLF